MNDKIAYYNQFEEKMAQALIRLCQECNYIGDQLLEVEELDLKWHEMAPEYMINAVPDIAKYPMVAIGWASYLGMGMATVWDGDWEQYSKKEDLYQSFVAPRGWDSMDDYIMETLMGFKPDSEEKNQLVILMQDLSELALTLIRKEHIEPQSVDAFHIFARTVKTMFSIGVSIALKMLGYKYEKLTLPQA